MSELRPCPFCGGSNTCTVRESEHEELWTVTCWDCSFSGRRYDFKVDAENWWNARTFRPSGASGGGCSG